MRKIIALLLLSVMCLYMTACGKSAEAQALDDKILTIGKVTLESKELIEEIEREYQQLNDKDKKSLQNYHIVITARSNLDRQTEKVMTFAKKLTAIFDEKYVANTCKIVDCWYYYDNSKNSHYFTYYISAINGEDGKFYGNQFGFSDLSDETFEAELDYHEEQHIWGFNIKHTSHDFKLGEKTALEKGIKLDAEEIYDYFVKTFY